MGLLEKPSVVIAIVLTAIWTAWLVGMIYEFGPVVEKWWKGRCLRRASAR